MVFWTHLLWALWVDAPLAPEPPRPSVLLVTLGGVGSERLGDRPMATLEALHERGTTFSRAYVPSPDAWVCTAALATAAPPPVNGVRGPDRELLPSARPVGEVLEEAGWRTQFSGRARPAGIPGFNCAPDPPASDQMLAAATVATFDPSRPEVHWVHLDDAEWPCAGADVHAADRCAAALDLVDDALATLVEAWQPGPDRWLAVAGTAPLVLAADGHPSLGAVLDDTHLRVPLVVIGGGFLPGDDDTPVGLVDLSATLLALATPPRHGVDLRMDRPSGVWHESHAGQRWLGLVPLYGWTFVDGRYVEGAWAATYPVVAGGTAIAAQPTHRTPRGPSTRSEARQLAEARGDDRWGPVLWATSAGTCGDPQPQPGAGDPRDAAAALAMVPRIRGLVDRGLFVPAERELGRLGAMRRGSWAVRWTAHELALARGEHDRSLDRLARLYADTGSAAAAVRSARILLALDRPAEALDAATPALRAEPTAPGIASLVGIAHARLGDLDAGWEIASALVAHDGDPMLLLGELALAGGAHGDARDIALDRLAVAPGDLDAHLLLGRAAQGLGELDLAAAELNHVVTAMRHNVVARRALASLAVEQGEPALALRLIAPVLHTDTTDPDLALVRAAEAALEDERGPQVPKRPWR